MHFTKIADMLYMKYIFNYLLTLLLLNLFFSCETKKTGSAPSMATDSPSTTAPAPAEPITKEQEMLLLVQNFKTTYSASFTFLTDFKPGSSMNSGGGSTTIVGVCEVYSDGSKQVHFNQDWWPTATALAKKILVFHELGHCFFQRGHDTRLYSGVRPYSIMYPILDPVLTYFDSYTNYYITELQNPIALDTIEYPITFSTTADGLCSDN